MNIPIYCIIVDDEPLAIKILERFVAEIPRLQLVTTCQSAVEAFEVLKEEKVDLIFLDINMPLLTGIDFVKSLRQPPGIIFTTAYRNYAVESYELNVVDYLVKPIAFTRFFKAVNKFIEQQSTPIIEPVATPMATQTTDYLYVNSNKKYLKVVFADILYIESIKDYIRIHLREKNIITKDKISAFAKKLPANFLRIHRSYIVNTAQISAFTALDVEIGEREIPIGNSYKNEVLARLKQQ